MTTRRKTDTPGLTDFGSPLTRQISAKMRNRREGLHQLAAAEIAAAAARTRRRNDPLPHLELVSLPIADLKLPPRRLRKREAAHVREVEGSIRTFGFVVPVLLGKDDEVINGGVALAAAERIGLDRVPCLRIGHLSPTEQRLLRLALNRLAEKGEWDLQTLKIEFSELILEDAPIEIAGFAADEIDTILSLDPNDGVEAAALAPAPGAIAVARRGDLFRLGLHRVYCCDATDPAAMRRLMAREASKGPGPGGQDRAVANPAGVNSKPFSPRAAIAARAATVAHGGPLARIVLTDQPYNVPIGGHVTGGPHREFVMASGEMSPAEYLAFNEAWMAAVLPHLINGGIFGTFIDWRGYGTVDAAALSLGLVPLNLVVWEKSNAGQGSLYRSQHELLPLYRKGEAPHVNNIALGKRGRWRSNVWRYPGASSLGSEARRGLVDHPTVKPAAMLADALIDMTDRGDVVVDPFLGSGSTLIAAHRTGRVCYGVELDPIFVDLVIRRFEAETGEKAILAETGETFAALKARRAGAAVAVAGAQPSEPEPTETPPAGSVSSSGRRKPRRCGAPA